MFRLPLTTIWSLPGPAGTLPSSRLNRLLLLMPRLPLMASVPATLRRPGFTVALLASVVLPATVPKPFSVWLPMST